MFQPSNGATQRAPQFNLLFFNQEAVRYILLTVSNVIFPGLRVAADRQTLEIVRGVYGAAEPGLADPR